MPVENCIDFMIVGQGLAGCLLARAMKKRGVSCVLVGKNLPMAATPAAAGIMNPVTGRRLAKSWKADVFLPYAKDFYRELGQAWDTRLLREGRILRFPKNEEELTRFRDRKTDPHFEAFLGAEFPPGHWGKQEWLDELGSYEILEVSWVEVEKIAATIRAKLDENGILLDECFEYKDLKISGTGCQWREVKAKCIVFCEGARVVENPWFQDLPFTPSRGETLDLTNHDISDEEILQSRFWLLSSPDGVLRAGATYDHEDLTSGPTKTGREQILGGLARFLQVPPEVTGQRCGLRSVTRDRLPVMGRHPVYPNIALFNGFGSKGASWVPLLSENFTSHLLDGKSLDPEVDLGRFSKDNSS